MTKKSTGKAIDVAAVEIADDPQIAELQRITTIDKANEVAKFDPIKARASQLVNEIQLTVYDITTTEGEDTAKALRRRCVGMRTAADAVYKTWNRPVLDAQTEMRAIVASIVQLVTPVETVLDEAIKAKEKLREEVRLAKIAAEQARISALRAKITSLASLPTAAAKAMHACDIQTLLSTLDSCVLDEHTYAEFLDEATALHAEIKAQLSEMLLSAQAREAQAAQLAAQALQLKAERHAQELAAKRASAILIIRAYPLDAMGLSTGEILDFKNSLVSPSVAEFGDELPAAESAFASAMLKIQGIYAEVQVSEAAARAVRLAAVADAQRRLDDQQAADKRQQEATASAVILKNQQDAFEEERRIAAAEIATEKERMAVERKALQAQADALANPPAAVVVKASDDESTIPATPISDALLGKALVGAAPGLVDSVVAKIYAQIPAAEAADASPDEQNAYDILNDMRYPGESCLQTLNRLFHTGTHAALVRLHATLKAEQLEEIPA